MPFDPTLHLIQEKPANILAILQRVKFEGRQLGGHSMSSEAGWGKKASAEIDRYLAILSQSSSLPGHNLDQYRKFPTEELTQLRTALDDMTTAPYKSHEAVPVLEEVATQLCKVRISELKEFERMQPPRHHAKPCAQVLVNIKLDQLGEELYEVALNGEIRSVEKYLEFKQKSGWGLLRNYLLHAITFRWSAKESVLQYEVLLEIIIARDHVHKSGITVSAFWHSLEDRNHQQMHRTPETSLMKVLQDCTKSGGEAFPQISQEYVNPTYSWDHKQLSVRKRMVYGYRS